MDIITTPAAVYSPPSTAILHNTTASLTDRSPTAPVHLVQYDQTVPVIAVSLTENGSQYTVPSGAAVNVRMDKPDGKHVYDPALGISEDGKTVYIGVTAQMTAAWGRSNPIVEIVIDGGIVGTAAFPVIIDQNPVPDSAYESTDEYLTLYEILQQAQNAAQIVQQNAQNLQNLTDNLEAVQNAAANAQAAAASAAAAQKAAQEALGFRTFFSAITPDANGNLDPSRPMTTPSAQASWTIESQGARIQSVQVNGFTQQSGTGDPSPTNVRDISTAGLWMVAVTFDGSADEAWAQQSAPAGYRYYIALPGVTTIDASTGTAFASNLQIGAAGSVGQPGNSNIFTVAAGNLYVYTNGADLATFKQQLASNPLMLWFVPTDESQATGLYIPIQAQGHEYRCQCLELTAPLCDGDKVESCVPSGCDKRIVLTGSMISNILNGVVFFAGSISDGLPINSGNALSDMFNYTQVASWTNLSAGQFAYSNAQIGFNDGTYFSDDDKPAAIAHYNEHPLTVWYRSTGYTEKKDLPVQLETHNSILRQFTGASGEGWAALGSNGAYIAWSVSAKYTGTADVISDYLPAKTPTETYSGTVGISISSDGHPQVRLPDGAAPSAYFADNPLTAVYGLTTPAVYARDSVTLVAVPYTAADSDQTAGTYTISSHDGTTVAVSLKAMQDGGDAATLGGLTLDDIKQLISDAVAAAVQMAQA